MLQLQTDGFGWRMFLTLRRFTRWTKSWQPGVRRLRLLYEPKIKQRPPTRRALQPYIAV
jgi:hypothetical protein